MSLFRKKSLSALLASAADSEKGLKRTLGATNLVALGIGAIIGAGLFGRLVGFYPIESSITAGLCMANMGGSGDIATLAAAKRMALLPFATISSRLGGALILVLASLMVRMLGVG